MAVTETKKRGRGRPRKTDKKAEARQKAEKLLEGFPVSKSKKSPSEIKEKPKPKDTDSEWLMEQLDGANSKIKELESQLVTYKESYDKLLNDKKGGDNANLEKELRAFFSDLIKRDQARAQFGGAVVKLNYGGPGPVGILQEMMQRFPFLK
jgi:hypothetical protein